MDGASWNEITNTIYSPANFQDAEQPVSITFDLSGTGSTTPYTDAAHTILHKHINEIKEKSMASLPKPTDWKKRLREFLSRKNTELLDFMNLSLPSHPTLGKGDLIIRKFGNSNINQKTTQSIKNIVVDISGADVFGEIKAALYANRTEDSVQDFTAAIQYIYEEYRKAGDAILKCETLLKVKLDTFDRIQKNVVSLLELEPATCTEELMVSSEKYLGEIFDKHKIQPVYEELVESYRRFVIVREFVQMMRVVQTNENEPLCTICLANIVSYCLTPCGHTYCEQCLRRMPVSCFMCRTPVSNRVKLFFG